MKKDHSEQIEAKYISDIGHKGIATIQEQDLKVLGNGEELQKDKKQL
jgi:hypothetical protein